jgi:hypothetical protein
VCEINNETQHIIAGGHKFGDSPHSTTYEPVVAIIAPKRSYRTMVNVSLRWETDRNFLAALPIFTGQAVPVLPPSAALCAAPLRSSR